MPGTDVNTSFVQEELPEEEDDLAEIMKEFNWRDKYAEEDVLELPVVQYGKEIKLRAYRYPPKEYRKAVVFYIHGYGSYANQNGALAKVLAAKNYEVFAIDQRGFGHSEGIRGLIEEKSHVYEDQWLLIFEAIKKYGIDQQKTPMFLFGRSFGGLLATNMATGPIASSMFAGACVLTPYYRCWTEKLYENHNLISFLDKVYPAYVAPSEFQQRSPEWMAKWGESEADETFVSKFTARGAKLWIEEQEKAQQSLLETEVPFLIVEAEKDDVVRNDVMKRYYENCEKAGKPHEYCVVSGEESDHSVVVMCPVLAGAVLKNVVNFFDRQIELRKIKKVQLQFSSLE